jgi:hypothetical protein
MSWPRNCGARIRSAKKEGLPPGGQRNGRPNRLFAFATAGCYPPITLLSKAMGPLCSECGRTEATITFHVTEDDVALPAVELCAACYAASLPPGFSDELAGTEGRDRHLHISKHIHCVDQYGNSLGPEEPFPRPDRFPHNGFDQIESYISRLLVRSPQFRSAIIFTPDGNRGLGLHARDEEVTANLQVDWRQNPKREAAIRGFFTALGIKPRRDYLAGNGGISDSIRCFSYPVVGTVGEITLLTQRILSELCGISPTEALDITFQQR